MTIGKLPINIYWNIVYKVWIWIKSQTECIVMIVPNLHPVTEKYSTVHNFLQILHFFHISG